MAKSKNIKLNEFLKLDIQAIREIIEERNIPKNIALMADGTRRMLKLQPDFRNDYWLYEQSHINKMMEKVM